MARPSLANNVIGDSNTFEQWINVTNDILTLLSNNVITTSNTAAGDSTTGNFTLVGDIFATNITAAGDMSANNITVNAINITDFETDTITANVATFNSLSVVNFTIGDFTLTGDLYAENAIITYDITSNTLSANTITAIDGFVGNLTGNVVGNVTGTVSSIANHSVTTLNDWPALVSVTEVGYLDGVTSAIQTQLNAKAALASPALTGNPTAPTQVSSDNSTKLATTAFVNTFVGDVQRYDANGDISFTGELNALSFHETMIDLGTNTAPTIDCSLANAFELTTAGTTTFTFDFSNVQLTGNFYAMIIKITAGGSHTVNWPATVDWPDGSAPAAPASGTTDVYGFMTFDGGTNWIGNLGLDNVS